MIPRASHLPTTPEQAAAQGKIYFGPNMPDKGKLDGSCNRSGCQLPLKGKPQYRMREQVWLHYCGDCANKFAEVDQANGRPPRCELVE